MLALRIEQGQAYCGRPGCWESIGRVARRVFTSKEEDVVILGAGWVGVAGIWTRRPRQRRRDLGDNPYAFFPPGPGEIACPRCGSRHAVARIEQHRNPAAIEAERAAVRVTAPWNRLPPTRDKR